MTSVYSINFPPARLMAAGCFGLIQASRNTLQIKQRQLTVKHMILPVVLLIFSQQKWWRREKPTPPGEWELHLRLGRSKKETGLVNTCPASSTHCFSGQDCVLVKLLQDQHKPSLHSLEIMQGLHVYVVCDHLVLRVVLRVTQRSFLQWKQDGFPVQINLGQGMALFSVELARQNKTKKRQMHYMNERRNLFKARTKIAGILSVVKNKISVRVRGKSIFRAWETT